MDAMQADRVQVFAAQTPPAPALDAGLDWLTFISAMTAHLAWPLLILFLVLLFRKPLVDLLAGLEEWEGFGTKAKFAREALQLRAMSLEVVDGGTFDDPPVVANGKAEMSGSGRIEAKSETVDEGDRVDARGELDPMIERADAFLSHIADDHPELRVRVIFSTVEGMLRQLAASKGLSKFATYATLVNELAAMGAIQPATASLLFGLRRLAHRARHARVTDESAVNFEETATAVIAVLRKALVTG